ncbi:HAD family hydrolase [Planctomycetota bacterium]
MIKLAIFDLDDTLYDEVDYCRSGLSSVAQLLAESTEGATAEDVFGVLWGQFNAGDRTKIFNDALDKLGIDYTADFIMSLVKHYREHKPDIILPDDSRTVLEQLQGKYTLALLTDGFLPAQKLKARALGIEKYFKCIIYTEELGREFWKPNPAGFKKILAQLQTQADSSVYIGDNEKKDFIAPNELGFKTIKLIRPRGIHTEVSTEQGASAGYVIHNISELPGLLAKL